MMTHQAKILFLGTGASTGVPVIGCACKVCLSSDPRNHRLRSGLLLSYGEKNFLLDVGPDFRQQALLHKIPVPEALFLTHTHYDHVGGLEELRAYCYHTRRPIPCFLSRASFESIQKMYYYLFLPKSEARNKTAEVDFCVLEDAEGKFSFDGQAVQYFSYAQGGIPVLGFRFGNIACVTDIKEVAPSLYHILEDVELLIVSATCLKHSHLHMTIEEAVAFAQKVRAKKTYFVHLSHEIEYEKVSSLLPRGVFLAYDGLEIEFPWKRE